MPITQLLKPKVLFQNANLGGYNAILYDGNKVKELAYIVSVAPYQDTYNNYAQICMIFRTLIYIYSSLYLLQGTMFETVLI